MEISGKGESNVITLYPGENGRPLGDIGGDRDGGDRVINKKPSNDDVPDDDDEGDTGDDNSDNKADNPKTDYSGGKSPSRGGYSIIVPTINSKPQPQVNEDKSATLNTLLHMQAFEDNELKDDAISNVVSLVTVGEEAQADDVQADNEGQADEEAQANEDDKYTAKGPRAKNGVLLLDEEALEEYPVLFLINGWEFYNGQLLSPEDFAQAPPLPNEYIFIGQYGGFEAGDLSAPPYGSASYRLNIIIPEAPRAYMLELPEIFSAYSIFINGKEMMTMGNPSPSSYSRETGNKVLSFEAAGNIEILIAATDYSHIYSGMVYPPAFGAPDAVSSLLFTRLIIRSLLCAAALIIGLLALMVGFLSRKNTLAILYGLMCLFFIGYTNYPITRTLAHGFFPLYAIESFSLRGFITAAAVLA